MENRIALLGIVIENPELSKQINDLLHEYSEYIVARLGVPYRERGLSIISIVMDAPNDAISALSGKLGRLNGVQCKAMYTKENSGGIQMKKRFLGLVLAMMLGLSACGGQNTASSATPSTPADTTASTQTESKPVEQEADTYVAKVASMKGPTSMGMAQLMTSESENFSFEMFTEGSEIIPLMVKEKIDIALIPANLAATLYQKTEGKIQVININTLGVLDVVAPATLEIDSFDDLQGKTIYMTGKGTTPESAVRYLTKQYGMDELDIEFQSEATAVVSALTANPDAVAILPQPFATVAKVQNEGMEIKLSLTDAWETVVQDDSSLLTGVTVARTAFIEEHPARLAEFMEAAKASVEFVNANVEESAVMVENIGIVKAPIGKQAIPRCNLVSITGEEMQNRLSGYLNALYEFDASLVGGKLPDANFYYIP